MAAGKHREIHDVQQSKKITPLITRETAFKSTSSTSWFFGVNIFDLDLGFQTDSVKKNKQAQLCGVLDTCLIVGLLPLMIILITPPLTSDAQLRLALRRILRLW